MKNGKIQSPAEHPYCAMIGSIVIGAVLIQAIGCYPCGIMGDQLALHGTVVDSASLEPLSDLALGGRTFTDGRETDYLSVLIFDGTANNPPPGPDGSFAVTFRVTKGFCTNPFARPPSPPNFPIPDRVEIIVRRDGCEETFSIDINEETVVDLSFPDDTLVLKDPILVGPCEE